MKNKSDVGAIVCVAACCVCGYMHTALSIFYSSIRKLSCFGGSTLTHRQRMWLSVSCALRVPHLRKHTDEAHRWRGMPDVFIHTIAKIKVSILAKENEKKKKKTCIVSTDKAHSHTRARGLRERTCINKNKLTGPPTSGKYKKYVATLTHHPMLSYRLRNANNSTSFWIIEIIFSNVWRSHGQFICTIAFQRCPANFLSQFFHK